MRDTAILGQLEGLLGLGVNPLDRFVSGTLGTVAATFRTWGSLWAMLPRGGVDIWGADDHLGAPDASNDESTGVTMDAPSSEREEHVELAREPMRPGGIDAAGACAGAGGSRSSASVPAASVCFCQCSTTPDTVSALCHMPRRARRGLTGEQRIEGGGARGAPAPTAGGGRGRRRPPRPRSC